jgi:glutaredoxin
MDTAPTTNRKASFYLKRISGIILILALSGVFFFSGYSKMYSDNAFDNFQWSFLDIGISNILLAGIIARLFIGLEFLLGLFLLFHIFLRRFTYPAVIAILSFFIVYLLVVLLKQGNTGNCGCFGDKLAMKPLAAIWKNVGMIAATVLLMFIYPVKPYKFQDYICLFLALVAFSMPFLLNFVATDTSPEVYKEQLNLDPLYSYTPAPEIDLRKGKHIIAFMSLTCPHCKKAAYLLQIIHHEHPEIPMYMVLAGHESQQKKFFEETHSEQVPHLFFNQTDDFVKMAGKSVPSILWVNNGVPEYKSVFAYYQLDPRFMLNWLKKP